MRSIHLSGFLLILALFFLPFMQISCSGKKVAAFSGRQLASGFTVQGDEKAGVQHSNAIRLAMGAAVVGFLTAAVGLRNAVVFLLAASTGMGALLSFQDGVREVAGRYAGLVALDLQPAYWACLFLFAGLGILNLGRILRSTRPSG